MQTEKRCRSALQTLHRADYLHRTLCTVQRPPMERITRQPGGVPSIQSATAVAIVGVALATICTQESVRCQSAMFILCRLCTLSMITFFKPHQDAARSVLWSLVIVTITACIGFSERSGLTRISSDPTEGFILLAVQGVPLLAVCIMVASTCPWRATAVWTCLRFATAFVTVVALLGLLCFSSMSTSYSADQLPMEICSSLACIALTILQSPAGRTRIVSGVDVLAASLPPIGTGICTGPTSIHSGFRSPTMASRKAPSPALIGHGTTAVENAGTIAIEKGVQMARDAPRAAPCAECSVTAAGVGGGSGLLATSPALPCSTGTDPQQRSWLSDSVGASLLHAHAADVQPESLRLLHDEVRRHNEMNQELEAQVAKQLTEMGLPLTGLLSSAEPHVAVAPAGGTRSPETMASSYLSRRSLRRLSHPMGSSASSSRSSRNVSRSSSFEHSSDTKSQAAQSACGYESRRPSGANDADDDYSEVDASEVDASELHESDSCASSEPCTDSEASTFLMDDDCSNLYVNASNAASVLGYTNSPEE